MADFRNTPFTGELEVITLMRDRVIQASMTERKRQEELTAVLREAVANGVGIDALSEASGLRPSEIERRVASLVELG
jgi:hypothetical protein